MAKTLTDAFIWVIGRFAVYGRDNLDALPEIRRGEPIAHHETDFPSRITVIVRSGGSYWVMGWIECTGEDAWANGDFVSAQAAALHVRDEEHRIALVKQLNPDALIPGSTRASRCTTGSAPASPPPDTTLPAYDVSHACDECLQHTNREQGRTILRMRSEMSASEALYGFMAWLTTRRDVAGPFSAEHDVAPAADLVAEFCRVNRLGGPREGWERRLTHPPDAADAGDEAQRRMRQEMDRAVRSRTGRECRMERANAEEMADELTAIEHLCSGHDTAFAGEYDVSRLRRLLRKVGR